MLRGFTMSKKGCLFVERPKTPRYGNSKYSSKGKLPSSQKFCPTHNCLPIHNPCNIMWKIDTNPSTGKCTVFNSGHHDHLSPPPVKIPSSAFKSLQKHVESNSGLLPSQLDVGRGNRAPIGSVHLSLANKGRVKYQMSKIKQDTPSYFSGLKGSIGKGEDSLFEILRKLTALGKTKDFITKSIVVDSCAGGSERAQFVSFMTDGMNDLILKGNTSFQTDTIEGVVLSIYFQGEMNITMTSGWDYLLDKHVPLVVTILCGKSARDYKEH